MEEFVVAAGYHNGSRAYLSVLLTGFRSLVLEEINDEDRPVLQPAMRAENLWGCVEELLRRNRRVYV